MSFGPFSTSLSSTHWVSTVSYQQPSTAATPAFANKPMTPHLIHGSSLDLPYSALVNPYLDIAVNLVAPTAQQHPAQPAFSLLGHVARTTALTCLPTTQPFEEALTTVCALSCVVDRGSRCSNSSSQCRPALPPPKKQAMPQQGITKPHAAGTPTQLAAAGRHHPQMATAAGRTRRQAVQAATTGRPPGLRSQPWPAMTTYVTRRGRLTSAGSHHSGCR